MKKWKLFARESNYYFCYLFCGDGDDIFYMFLNVSKKIQGGACSQTVGGRYSR